MYPHIPHCPDRVGSRIFAAPVFGETSRYMRTKKKFYTNTEKKKFAF